MSSACQSCGAKLAPSAMLCSDCGALVSARNSGAPPGTPVVRTGTGTGWGGLALPTDKRSVPSPPRPPAPPTRAATSIAPSLLLDEELPAALGGPAAASTPPPSAPRPPAPPPQRPPQPPQRMHAGLTNLASSMDHLPSLELDAPTEAQQPMRPIRGRVSVAGQQDASPTPDEFKAESRFSRNEPLNEVAALARYGRIPEGPIAAVTYAIKVGLRRMEIASTLTRLTAERGRAAAEADRALIGLGQALYQHRDDPRLEELAPDIERVMQADQTLGERNAAHQGARWEVVDELATLDQVVADTSATIDPIREHEVNLQRYLDELSDASRRTQARLQRVDIQVRALHGSDSTKEDPEQLPTLEAERRVREQEVKALAKQMAQVRGALGEARRELAAHFGTLEALREDQQGRHRALQERDDVHKNYTGEAVDAMTHALRRLAQSALTHGMFVVAELETRKAESAVQRLKDRDRDEALHKEAIDSYDGGAVRTGVIVMVAGFLGALVLLRVFRSLGGHF